MRRLLFIACSGLIAFGCSAIVNLDRYAQCDALDACATVVVPEGGGGGGDAPNTVDVGPPRPCTSSAECASDPQHRTVCSRGACAAIRELYGNMSFHVCAQLSDESLWCWGSNGLGELGRGFAGPALGPGPVTLGSEANAGETAVLQQPFTDVGLGQGFTCVLTQNKSVWCWGKGSDMGMSGPPTKVIGANASELSVGGEAACAVLLSGEVQCWGGNPHGAIGCGDAGPQAVKPPIVQSLGKAAHVATGTYATCALQGGSANNLACFGNNNYGGLATGVTKNADCASSMVALPGTFNAIIATELYACAQTNNSTWWCWGQGSGIWPNNSIGPVYLDYLKTQFNLDPSFGRNHACGVSNTKKVSCWGTSVNMKGELGSNAAFQKDPALVSNLPAVKQVLAMREKSCALGEDGFVYCWGNNAEGVITADGKPDNDPHPVPSRITFP